MNKEDLLRVMNTMGFDIADISCVGREEFYAHKLQGSDDLAWFHISSGGSGFNRLFKGAICKALKVEDNAESG